MRIQEVVQEGPGQTHESVLEKRLSSRERGVPAAVSRLRHEGQVLLALGGRVTPRFVDAGQDAGGPWFRMSKIPFPTLAERIEATHTPLDFDWLNKGVRAAFSALAMVHDAVDEHGPLNVVHADVSPSNLAVSDRGTEAILLDLELASSRARGPEKDGAFRGTVSYCAPEIARGEPALVVSDLFALAASFLHAWTGVLPRNGPSLPVALAIAAERPLREFATIPNTFPAPLFDCLAHDPQLRPQAARDVLARLNDIE
jgi:serine/threonine protein kinase